jgi:hypothetical protein
MLESKMTKPPELQFKVIREELDQLIEALSNLLDREFPRDLTSIPGLQPFFLVAVLTSKNIYQGIRYLAADLPKDPTRKLEFGLIISPLGRMLADILFTIVFMREDLRPRVEWYHRGGWRELREYYERNRSEYGSLPEWENWFRQFENLLEQQRVVFGISEEDAANPKNLPYWPIPSRMLRDKGRSERSQRFLQFLNDWLYKELSSDAHMSAAGIMRHHGQLLREKGEEREKILSKLKSDSILTVITLMVAICSEINDICHYGREEKLSYLWRILVEYWGEAKDFFERRYREML